MERTRTIEELEQEFSRVEFEVLAWLLHGFAVPDEVKAAYKALGSELQSAALHEVKR